MAAQKQAAVYWNDKAIAVVAESGCMLFGMDLQGGLAILPRDVLADDLGPAVQHALGNSREMSPAEVKTYFERSLVSARHQTFIQSLVEAGGGQSKADVERSLHMCRVYRSGDTIRIRTARKDGAGWWEAEDGGWNGAPSTSQELGTAVLSVMSK